MENKADYFPVFIKITGKKVLIFGGGNIALRRVRTLSLFNFDVTVVAKEILPELKEFCAQADIKYDERAFIEGEIIRRSDLDFVIAATNDRGVNGRISLECGVRRIPVSVCDNKSLSNFFFPAIIKKEDIVIGLSSGGTNYKGLSDTAAKIREFIAT